MQVSIQQLKPNMLIEPELQKVFELKTLILTADECIDALAPVINQPGWHHLNTIRADQVTVRSTSRTRTTTRRCDKVVLLSNGANTIEIHDWLEKNSTVQLPIHDPEIRIIGPDARGIFDVLYHGVIDLLVQKVFEIRTTMHTAVVDEIAKIAGVDNRLSDDYLPHKFRARIENTAKELAEALRFELHQMMIGEPVGGL